MLISEATATTVLDTLHATPHGLSVDALAQIVGVETPDLEQMLLRCGRSLGLGVRDGIWIVGINDGTRHPSEC
jgi:hypothetical protein